MEPTYVIIIVLVVAVLVLVLRLASRPGARAGGDLQALRDSVAQLEDRVRDQLSPQVGNVHKIADELHRTLHSPNRRGQWAEQSLANVLENSGLRKDHDYQLQFKTDVDDSYQKPDAVVFMPQGIKVVIDSKAAWDSYQQAQLTDTDKAAEPHLQHHAATLLERAAELGNKNYADAIDGSADFVLMFVPADPIVDAAMKVQPTLWEQAWRKHKVLIATPGTLMAFLRTVALAWQQQEMAENAQQIADLGKILFDRLRTFSERLQEMGDGLNKAVESYNTGVNSFRLRVIPQARRFQELGAVARTEQLAEPEPVRQPTPTSE